MRNDMAQRRGRKDQPAPIDTERVHLLGSALVMGQALVGGEVKHDIDTGQGTLFQQWVCDALQL